MRKVSNCALEDVGELDFEYDSTGNTCNTFSFGILLCFTWYANHAELDHAFKDCFS